MNTNSIICLLACIIVFTQATYLLHGGSRKFIVAEGAGTADGTKLIIYNSYGSSFNSFTLTAEGYLYHQGSGKYVVAEGAGTADGTKLMLYNSVGGTFNTFTWVGNYLKHVGSGKYVVAEGAGTADGTKLILYSSVGGNFNYFSFNDGSCNYLINIRCFKEWSGTSFTAGQKFLIRTTVIYQLYNMYPSFRDLLKPGADFTWGGVYKGTTLQPQHWVYVGPYQPAVADPINSINPIDTMILYPTNVANSNEADWYFESNNNPVYWDSMHGCGGTMPRAKIYSTGDTSNPSTYYIKTNGCGGWSTRIYQATDVNSIKADYDGYADVRLYYYKLFVEV